jgi:glyoxylase-like metal-dependent hydrolase (beta-lactamase superfamily II)
MIKSALFAATAMLALTGMQAPPKPALSMWRLDCGSIQVGDLNVFSDTFAYVGQSKTLTNSCYLIRNGDRLLLWDTGLPGENAGQNSSLGSMTVLVRRRIVDQLAEIGVRPAQVNFRRHQP